MAITLERSAHAAQLRHPLVFDYVRGDQSLIDALADEWYGLCARGGSPHPFSRPALTRAYVEAFAPDAEVVLVTARRQGQLVALLPLVERTVGVGRIALRWLHSTANTHASRFDVIHAGVDPSLLAEELWHFLASTGGWDLIQIDATPAGGVADRMRYVAARLGARSMLHRPEATPYIPLDPVGHGSIEAILASRSRSFQSQLRRAIRHVEQRGPLQLVRIGPEAGVQGLRQAVQAFYQLEQAGWKGEAGTAILSNPATTRFYQLLVGDAILHQELVCHRLEVDGQPIAMEFGLMAGCTYLGLKTSYAEAYRRFSPGHLLVLYLLRDLASRGYKELNLGGTAEPYKLEWTDQSRPFGTVFLFRPGPSGRLAEHALTDAGPALRQRWGDRPLPAPVRRLMS